MGRKVEINIYGEVASFQGDAASEWGIVSLSSVQKQIDALGDLDDVDLIIVNINSPGGEVHEGFAIYEKLVSLNKKITTRGIGQVASIGTVIFLAGSEREAYDTLNFLIHFPWSMAIGTADDFERQTEELRKIEDKILDFYVKNTGADKEVLRGIMAKDTAMSISEAVELKFVTKVLEPVKAFAKLKKKTPETNQVEIIENMKKFFSEAFAQLKRLGVQDLDEVKNMDVTTTDGKTLQVEGEELVSGAKVSIDGSPAPDGTYELEDGTKIVVTGGAIESVEAGTSTEEGSDDKDEKIKKLEAENADLKKQLESSNNKVEDLTTDVEGMKSEVAVITESLKNLKIDVKVPRGHSPQNNEKKKQEDDAKEKAKVKAEMKEFTNKSKGAKK